MSEIRSWDQWKAETDPKMCENPVIKAYSTSVFTVPVRVVAWSEGAPKQEDVPQAGESVRYNECDKHYIVVSGIPTKISHGSAWHLKIQDNKGSWTGDVSIKALSPWPKPPTPPQTYTEEEIHAAIMSAQTSRSFVSAVIRNLP